LLPSGGFWDFASREIVKQSNLYAKQVMGDKFQKGHAMTRNELISLLGFYMLMAINHLPSTDDYWRCDLAMHYAPISDPVSHDCFHKLSSLCRP